MSNNIKRTEVDLLRHGEHVLGDVICGVTDPKLSAAGWQQLHNQCARLVKQGAQWDICITSPRKRCVQFAEHLSERLAIECVIEDGFAEVDFGRWEGLSYNEIETTYPGQWQAWLEHPAKPAPHGGDQYREFIQRIQQAWGALIARYKGRRILLIIHGGVTRAIFANVFALQPGTLFRFSVPHACHSRIIAYHQANAADWFQLEAHNTCPPK